MAKWIKALPLVLCLMALVCGVASAEEITRDGVVYEIEKNVARIVDFDPGADLVRIPATLDGKTVEIALRDEWAYHETKKMILGEGATTFAFNNIIRYWTVEELEIEEGVTAIGENALQSCTAAKITLPSTLREIGDYAFAFATGHETLDIPEGVESIGDYAFYGSEMQSVNLPGTLRSLGTGVFSDSAALQSFILSDSNPFFCIRDGALYSKDGKTLLAYPSGKGEEWTIPDGTTAIAENALQSSSLEILRIGEGLEVLSEMAIRRCYQLRELTLPASLETIEETAILYLPLEKIEVSKESAFFETDGSALYQIEGDTLVRFFNKDATSYSVRPGTKRICPNAFSQKEKLQSVTIPRGVTKIEENTFNECISLAVVQLPITLDTIGDSAFAYCFSLERMALPGNLTRIGSWAFSGCQSLHTLEIPKGVESILDYAFVDCSNLTLTATEGTYGAIYARQYNAENGRNAARQGGRYGIVANENKETTLNLRSEPSAQSNVINAYQNGVAVEILSEEGQWLHVAIGEAEGYVESQYIDEVTYEHQIFYLHSGTVRKTLAVLRHPLEGSGSDFSVNAGASVIIVELAGCYYKIQENGLKGYVLTTDVSVEIPYAYDERLGIVANPDYHDRLNLRDSPSTGAKSIGRYYNGVHVQILSEEGDWYRVRVGQGLGEGYMMKKFIEEIK